MDALINRRVETSSDRDTGWRQGTFPALTDLPIPSCSSVRAEIERLCLCHDAVLLYGSCARGDARADSDVDLLVVGEARKPKNRMPERFSVTAYTAAHLRGMARRGSLFVLHLRTESRTLVDRRSIIKPLLNAWRAPDYSRMREGMKAAASALDLASKTEPASRLRRMFLFVLRSVLYAECAERGRPTFAMSSVAAVLGDVRIANLFTGLDAKTDSCILRIANELFSTYLGKKTENQFEDLEALAVSWHKPYPLASHIAVQIITTGTEIGYSSAPIDWVST